MSEHPPAAGHGHDAHAAPAHGATGSGIGGKILNGTRKVLEAPFRAIGWGGEKVWEGARGSVGFLRNRFRGLVLATGVFTAGITGIQAGAKHLGFDPHPKGMIASAGKLAKGTIDGANTLITTPGVVVGTTIQTAAENLQDGVNTFFGLSGSKAEDHGHGGHDAHASHDAGHGDAHGGHDAGHDAGHGGHGHA